MRRTLTIGHGNGHNRRSLVNYVRDAEADSFGGNEAQRLLPELEDLGRYRVIGGEEGWNEPRNRANATAIVTANRNPSLGQLSRQVSEAIPGRERIAPDRVLRGSFFEHPVATALGREGVAHFELHPDATVMAHEDPDHPIVREYREALESTRTHMAAARRDGLLLVLTGDLQARARYRAPWGPRELLAGPLRLNARVVGIDWIMVDELLAYAGPLIRHQLFDHTGFVAHLRASR